MQTISTKNINRPAPKWFRRTKKAVLILVAAANVMVAQWGFENELLVTRLQLWCTIGIGALLEAVGALLGNGEDYITNEESDNNSTN